MFVGEKVAEPGCRSFLSCLAFTWRVARVNPSTFPPPPRNPATPRRVRLSLRHNAQRSTSSPLCGIGDCVWP